MSFTMFHLFSKMDQALSSTKR